MRRSILLLSHRSLAFAKLSSSTLRVPQRTIHSVPLSSSASLCHASSRLCTARVVYVYGAPPTVSSTAVVRTPFCRALSTSLPSAGGPTSPSVSASNPSLGASHSVPHTQSPPHPPQQQPAAGPHPSHSTPASVTAAGSADGRIPLSNVPEPAHDDSATDIPAANESRLRRLFRQYGAVAVGSYLVIYVSTLGMLYVAIKERWLGGYDIQQLVDALGLSHHFEHIDPRKGDFAVAWIATKFTEPLRLALTVAITPTVARMAGRAPPKEGSGARAKLEARMKEGVEQAKDKVEERIREQSSKH